MDKALKKGQSSLFKYKLKPEDDIELIKKEKERYIVISYGDDHVEVYNKLYNKLVRKHESTKAKFKDNYNVDVLIWCLVKRYIYLKSYNQQLAVHPQTMKEMKQKFKVGFELFGSALNTYFDKYCSLFYDIEKYFGSFGSLNFFTPIKGNYTMNPPFDENLIKNSAKMIISSLKKSKDNLRIFIWIPVWDSNGMEHIKKTCKDSKIYMQNIYGKYEGLEIIEKSGFMKCKRIICMQDITYYNYMWFKNKIAANTYLITLDNHNKDDCKEIDSIRVYHEAVKGPAKKPIDKMQRN